MKKLTWISLLLLGFLISCNTQKSEPAQNRETVKDGVFIHVSSNDPHRVLMALRMAEMFSETHDVMMYFDIQGINVILNDAPDLTFAEFPSSHAQLNKLIEKGLEIHACPGCLKAMGKTPEDVRTGVKIAEKDKFFGFTKGRILTLDY